MPSCIASALSSQSTPDRTGERCEAGLDIAYNVRTHGAASTLCQYVEVPTRLRRLDNAERHIVYGNFEILCVLSGDLKK